MRITTRRLIVTRFQARGAIREKRFDRHKRDFSDISASATSRRSINARGELGQHNCYNCPVCGIGYWMHTCASAGLRGIELYYTHPPPPSICVSIYLFLPATCIDRTLSHNVLDRTERRTFAETKLPVCTKRRNWMPIMPVDVADVWRLQTNPAVWVSIADIIKHS